MSSNLITHSITCEGLATQITYRSQTDDVAQCEEARHGENGEQVLAHDSALVDITLSPNFREILSLDGINILLTSANAISTFQHYKILPDGTKNPLYGGGLRSVAKAGISPLEFCNFTGLLTNGTPFMEIIMKKVINQLLNFKFGNIEDEYEVQCFNPNTLVFQQPILFDSTQQTINTAAPEETPVYASEVTINVTDGGGSYEYKVEEGGSWQNSNIFTFASNETGVKTFFVRDAEGVINTRNINVVVNTPVV